MHPFRVRLVFQYETISHLHSHSLHNSKEQEKINLNHHNLDNQVWYPFFFFFLKFIFIGDNQVCKTKGTGSFFIFGNLVCYINQVESKPRASIWIWGSLKRERREASMAARRGRRLCWWRGGWLGPRLADVFL